MRLLFDTYLVPVAIIGVLSWSFLICRESIRSLLCDTNSQGQRSVPIGCAVSQSRYNRVGMFHDFRSTSVSSQQSSRKVLEFIFGHALTSLCSRTRPWDFAWGQVGNHVSEPSDICKLQVSRRALFHHWRLYFSASSSCSYRIRIRTLFRLCPLWTTSCVYLTCLASQYGQPICHEERMMGRYSVPPLLAVSYEGQFGTHSPSPLGLLKDTRCQCKDQPFVQLLPSLDLVQLLTFASLRTGQAASWGQPHTFCQELELSDHRRGPVRPFQPLREHQANTHRERAQDKGNRVRSIRRHHGCTFPSLHFTSSPPFFIFMTRPRTRWNI